MSQIAITAEVKKWAEDRIQHFNDTVIGDPDFGYAARYRGRFLYLDRLDCGEPSRVARLTYTGDLNAWEFTIYKYSSDRYDDEEWLFPGFGLLDGTIEGAMRAGLEAYP